MRPVDFMLAQPDEPAELHHQGTAAEVSNDVGQLRTQVAADGPGGSHQNQAKTSLRNQIAGKRHDDFRRQWNTGRFNGHDRHNAQIPSSTNYRDVEST